MPAPKNPPVLSPPAHRSDIPPKAPPPVLPGFPLLPHTGCGPIRQCCPIVFHESSHTETPVPHKKELLPTDIFHWIQFFFRLCAFASWKSPNLLCSFYKYEIPLAFYSVLPQFFLLFCHVHMLHCTDGSIFVQKDACAADKRIGLIVFHGIQ